MGEIILRDEIPYYLLNFQFIHVFINVSIIDFYCTLVNDL